MLLSFLHRICIALSRARYRQHSVMCKPKVSRAKPLTFRPGNRPEARPGNPKGPRWFDDRLRRAPGLRLRADGEEALAHGLAHLISRAPLLKGAIWQGGRGRMDVVFSLFLLFLSIVNVVWANSIQIPCVMDSADPERETQNESRCVNECWCVGASLLAGSQGRCGAHRRRAGIGCGGEAQRAVPQHAAAGAAARGARGARTGVGGASLLGLIWRLRSCS
jgi:hypothetical protein